MGASYWSCFVPYRANIEHAFQALRKDVFKGGKYYKPDFSEDTAVYDRKLFEQGIITQQELAGRLAALQDERELEPSTIEELLELRGADGTHSILDLERIVLTRSESLRPKSARGRLVIPEALLAQLPPGALESLRRQFHVPDISGPRDALGLPQGFFSESSGNMDDIGAVTPLTKREYSEVLGTLTPTRDLVMAKTTELVDLRGRGCGVFVIVHQGGQPTEICFAGLTGD